MPASPDRARTLHPFHAVMLAGVIPLFVGALLSDIAYWQTYEIQWTNFASWLVAGGLVFGAAALACAWFGTHRAIVRGAGRFAYPVALSITWILGFFNALVHARDGWASMPTGLVLSALVAVLACIAVWLAYASARIGGAP